MATNHLTNVEKGKELKLKIGCEQLECDQLTINESGITFPTNAGLSGQILEADGTGDLIWVNMPSGSGDVVAPPLPVEVNEIATYNNVDGTQLRGCNVKINPFGEMEFPLTGKIGIGEAPTANLSIKSKTLEDCIVKLNTTDLNSNSFIEFLDSDNRKWYMGNDGTDDVFKIFNDIGEVKFYVSDIESSAPVLSSGLVNTQRVNFLDDLNITKSTMYWDRGALSIEREANSLIVADNSRTNLYAPTNTSTQVSLENTSVQLSVNGLEKLNTNTTGTTLYGLTETTGKVFLDNDINLLNGITEYKQEVDNISLSNTVNTKLNLGTNDCTLTESGNIFLESVNGIIELKNLKPVLSPTGEYSIKINSNHLRLDSDANTRLNIDATQSLLLAPNLTTSVDVGDVSIINYVGTTNTILTNTEFSHTQLAEKRLKIGSTDSYLSSPNGDNNLYTNNFFSQISHANNPRVKVDGSISQPNLQNNINVSDISAFITQNGTNTFESDGVVTFVRGAGINTPYLSLSPLFGGTGGIILNIAGRNTFRANVSATYVGFDIDYRQTFTTTNFITTFNSLERERLTETQHIAFSPNTTSNTTLSDTNFNITVDGGDKINCTADAITIGGSYDIPIIAGTEGEFLQTNASGNLEFGLHQLFGSMQAEVTQAITLTNANQYYEFANGTNAVGSGEFTFGASQMTYTGNYPLFVRASLHVSSKRSSTGVSDTLNIAFLVDGVKQSGSCRFQIDNTSDFPNESSFETVFPIDTGAVISAVIENETSAGSIMDIYSYSFVISRV
jgi:hypothetical protein